jgi:hypothetical protein
MQAAKIAKSLRGHAIRVRAEHVDMFRYVVTGVDVNTGHAFIIRDFEEWRANPETAKHPLPAGAWTNRLTIA